MTKGSQKYKALFLDWDDTIGDFSHSADCALRDIYRQYNLTEFFDSFDEFFALYHPHNLELWTLYGEGKVDKEFLSIDRFLWPIVQGLGGHSILMHSPALQNLAKRISIDFLKLTTKYFSLIDGADLWIRRLADHYPLTIVSNGFVEVQYEKIERSGLKNCFQHIVLSEEVGCQKPNPHIFDVALELNQQAIPDLQRSEVLMIGDSYSSDIMGAKMAGIDQMWLQHTVSEDTATYIVHSYQEMIELLLP